MSDKEQNAIKTEKSQFSLKEEEILKFWKENRIFEKSVEQSNGRPYFSFYDGPPFLSGSPHYGHMLGTTIKDTVARYRTMKGFNVPRRVGWDCHGLPVENLIEKNLGIKDKKQIEEMGVASFNKACRESVFASLDVFEKTLQRVGRWADYDNAYMTLDNDYMESVWWVTKKLWDEGLIYKDYRVSPYCTRCGTPLSNFEVNQGYKDAVDPSIYIRFKVKNQENTYFLVWTTTPWTLTANVALAVGKDVDYVKIKKGEESLILAKARLGEIKEEYLVEEEMKGEKLLGSEYEPLFSYLPLEKKAHFVVTGDFVSTEDGTGIVHIAPAFGADDMAVGKTNNLPTLVTVNREGKFIAEVEPWAGKFVKSADKEIIKYLEENGILYKAQTITHTYPFCWRCDSPLLYYPLDTWYIAVEKLKESLVKNNQQINWNPAHIKEGRFGKWLEGARDWAFSRNRFWGAPLPVWECAGCEEKIAVSSIKEVSELVKKSGNNYFVMRHGEAEQNLKNIVSSDVAKSAQYNLTEKGRAEIAKSAESLKEKKIDFIFASDFHRTKQTAEEVAEIIGLDKEKIIYDERLREINTGLDGQPSETYHSNFSSLREKFTKILPGGENLTQLKQRVAGLLYELEDKHKGKNILVISHEYTVWMMFMVADALDDDTATKIKEEKDDFIDTGEVKELNLKLLPHNENYVLDLHRPYIDEVVLECPKCKTEMKRVEEVFDCWFESGAMPYAQYHYPQDNKELVESTFPADFIAEGLDQTRGWFYTLHVLATALTEKNIGLGLNKPAFKNVVVNGLILAKDGQKLSKKLRNFTEPEILMDTIGADSLRMYLLSSTMMGEDYLFSDKGVQELQRKTVASLYNSLNFFKTYTSEISKFKTPPASGNILDKWMLIRLAVAVKEVDDNMNAYDLTRSSRVFADYFDDLSNWFIRRSRARFQNPENEEDNASATNVLAYVLVETTKIMAPFAPFATEYVYQEFKKMGYDGLKESVHLDDFPKISEISDSDKKVLEQMVEVRKIVTIALEERMKAGVKVKQPLAVFETTSKVDEEFLQVAYGEINVKKIIGSQKENKLDTTITEELKKEGMVRELVRNIQDLRKQTGLNPQQKVELIVSADEVGKKLMSEFEEEIKKTTKLTGIKFGEVEGEEVKVGDMVFKLKIEK